MTACHVRASGGTAHRGPPGAGQARQGAGGESPPGDGQDHAGTPRPHALIPALDEGRLAALREIGRQWDRVSADPHVWRQALPADPSLGEYPEASEIRPTLFTRFVPVAGRGGQLPPIQTTSVSETPLTPPGRAGQALKRLVFGPPLDATAIAVERMRKLVALPVLSADALSSVAYRPQGCWASWSWSACPACRTRCPPARRSRLLMLAAGISYRQTIRAHPQGGGSFIVASEGTRPRPRRGRQLANYLWTLHEHVAETLQPVLQSLPRVVVTSVPFHLAD